MKISDANLKIIFDSRGKDALEAELKSDKFSASASVPAGKSTGSHEVFALEPKLALQKFEEIKPRILSAEFESQKEFDTFLIQLDGTENSQNIGGNLILALSLAFARLNAKNEGLELFEYVNQCFGRLTSDVGRRTSLRPIFNVINGGAHATNPQSKLAFQEFQIIPELNDFGISLGLGQEFYRKLKEVLKQKFGKENVLLGDETGFSCPFENDLQAIDILADLIKKYNYPLRIGIDAAASQFYRDGHYLIDGKNCSLGELRDFYSKLVSAYKIISIEDPFYEEDFDSFASLMALINEKKGDLLVITDDLTTTNSERLKTAIDKKSGNTILVKPNQIGTLTETLNVVKLAHENNWQTIISHRSGETMDDFIADLAVAVNAWGLKSGAPAAPERLVKYERVLKILEISN